MVRVGVIGLGMMGVTHLDVYAKLQGVKVAAIADADPAARVPSCPAWDLRELVVHLGRVQRSWASVIRRGEDVEPEPADAVRVTGDAALAAAFADWLVVE